MTSPPWRIIDSRWRSARPYPRMPAWGFLARAARERPTKVALIESDGRATTFDELYRHSLAMAGYLQRNANLCKGDTVAVGSRSSRETAAALFGVLLAGCRVTPINVSLRSFDAAYQLHNSGAKLAIVPSPLLTTIEHLRASGRLPCMQPALALESVWSLTEEEPPSPTVISINPDTDIALLSYSSGTDGAPKGVLTSHANFVSATVQQTVTSSWTPSSRVINARLFWTRIQVTIAAMATYISPAEDVECLIEQLQAYRATDLLVKPSLLVQLIELQHHRPRDLTTLRSIETGSEALAPEVAREAEELLRCTVLQAYHQTETCGSSNRASTADRTPGSVGGPVQDTDERIINIETEQDVAQGEIGELLIRGPQVMCGYWGDEAATFRALDSDGWLHTGDLVRQEADGQIAIVDRLNDMIKFRGLPIAPAEIEQVLLRHPAVREAAVVPVQFPADGQRPRAFVVLEPGADIAPVELIALIGAELAPHKLPDSLEFVASLPKNAAGKVQRRELTRFTRDKSSPSWGEFSG